MGKKKRALANQQSNQNNTLTVVRFKELSSFHDDTFEVLLLSYELRHDRMNNILSGLMESNDSALQKQMVSQRLHFDVNHFNFTINLLRNKLISELKFHNKFQKLYIKMAILEAKLLSFQQDHEGALDIYIRMLNTFKTSLEHPDFNYAEDMDFQDCMNTAFEHIAQLYLILKRWNSQSSADLKQISYDFAQKCAPRPMKLNLIYRYWIVPNVDGDNNIKKATPSEKREFINLSEYLIKKLNQSIEENPSAVDAKVQMAEIQLMTYQFALMTDSSIPFESSSNPSEMQVPSNDIKKRHLHVRSDFVKQYLVPSLELLQNIDEKSLTTVFNGESRFKELCKNLKLQLLSTVLLYKKWVASDVSEQAIPKVLLQNLINELRHIVILMQSLDHIIDSSKEERALKPSASLYQGIETLCQEINDREQKQIELAEQNKNAILRSEEIAEQRLEEARERNAAKNPINRSVSSTAPATSSTDKKTVPVVRKEDKIREQLYDYFGRAQSFMAIKNYDRAFETYRQIDDISKAHTRPLDRLSALEGQVSSLGHKILRDTERARQLVNLRFHKIHLFNQEQQIQLDYLTTTVKKEMDKLEHIHTEYRSVLGQLQATPEIGSQESMSLNASQGWVRDYIQQINAKTQELKELVNQLKDHIEKSRKAYLLKIAKDNLGSDEQAASYSEEELLDLGKEVLRTRKKEAREHNKNNFGYKYERQLVENVQTRMVTIMNSSAELASKYSQAEQPHPPVASVKLPKEIRDVFYALKNLPGEHYLVGGSVIQLLTQGKLNHADIDIASNCHDESLVVNFGFTRATKLPQLNLYQSSFSPRIDLTLNSSTSNHWLLEDFIKRDFTVCALYMNARGQTFDPSGLGKTDLDNRVLRLVGNNPGSRLSEDPTILLRIAYYMTKGFTLEPSLEEAVKQFRINKTDHQSHLHALLRKHLKRCDQVEYVTKLHQLGILHKLFAIDYPASHGKETNVQDLIAKLKQLVGLSKPAKVSDLSLFPKSTSASAQPAISSLTP